MKYAQQGECIPQDRRQELNDKILYLIDSGDADRQGITKGDIYNAYTGDGGLHGLQRSDYDNYYEYSEAKKEVENGQFFTPPELCRLVACCLSPSDTDVIADLTCGMGGFFNFLPMESNLYGCEIDAKAYKVARHLYPRARIENMDIRLYQPDIRFDFVVGNPPYNLRWWLQDGTEVLSQLYYCLKAEELLKPFGILAVITPMSFMADEFSDSGLIEEMEQRFSFLGQVGLPEDSFSTLGIARFPTKLQFWQKKIDMEGWAAKPYVPDIRFSLRPGFDAKKAAPFFHETMLKDAKALLEQNKTRALLNLAKDRGLSADFRYKVEKALYQIKIHPRLKSHYSRCCEYLHRFYTQEKPPKMDYQEWCRKRLTEFKVLAYLKKTVRKQNAPAPRDVIALVKRDYDFVYKGYSAKVRRQMSKEMKQPIPLYQVASSDGTEGFPGYERLIRKKQHAYIIQNQPFAKMEENPQIAQWLSAFTLWDAENEEEIRLNSIQRHDINLMLQKRYGLLQWEQGTGKTLAGIAVGLYRMERQHIHHTWVVSSAISIRNNWDVVLKNYRLPYVFLQRLADLQRIQPGDFVIVTLNKLSGYQKQIKKWVRMHGGKIQLVFDESDEITNLNSVRTKATLDCFRRCRSKLLTTGTSTRNNISEFAPQLELLYNNSVNMLSWCPTVYRYERGDKENLHAYRNSYFGKPIPAYKKGNTLFSSSHLPEKITVFGVGQRTQDIYNADVLSELLGKTVITRTFEEVAGKDIRRIHQVPMRFTPAERAVYQQAIEEFYKMRWNYFHSTGNHRKDAMMRLMQQIVLLLRISAAPNTVREYSGYTPVKIQKVVEMISEWDNEIVAIGVRHKVVLDSYVRAIEEACPGRPVFVVTGTATTFAKRRALRQTLRDSGNGILLCTQQSLPSSVNFEYVNKVIIPELHYNNSRMSQFYMRFIRYTSTEWKDIYFVTYAGSIESNQMQMVLAKEKINLFMKGQDTDLDEIYERFGVNYDLISLLMYREVDDKGDFHIRWGEQNIS